MVKWLVYFDEILPDINYMKDFIRQNFAKKMAGTNILEPCSQPRINAQLYTAVRGFIFLCPACLHTTLTRSMRIFLTYPFSRAI
jgi:hypothetical protein